MNELSRFEQECEGDLYDSESDEDDDTVVTDCDDDANYSAYMKNVNGMKKVSSLSFQKYKIQYNNVMSRAKMLQ